VEDNRQSEIGNWVGTQLTYRVRPFFAGDVTVGVETDIDLRAFLTNYDVTPAPVVYLSTSHPNRSFDLIFQDEKKLSEHWKVDMGVPLDKSYYQHDFVSPRVALIYQPSAWTYKLLYGRSLRNPCRRAPFWQSHHSRRAVEREQLPAGELWASEVHLQPLVFQFHFRRLALLPSALFMERSHRCQLGVLNVDRVLPSRTRTDALLSESRPSPTPQSPELGDLV
jgi:hypothetical protein